jgi:hypothetical protein
MSKDALGSGRAADIPHAHEQHTMLVLGSDARARVAIPGVQLADEAFYAH